MPCQSELLKGHAQRTDESSTLESLLQVQEACRLKAVLCRCSGCPQQRPSPVQGAVDDGKAYGKSEMRCKKFLYPTTMIVYSDIFF